LRRPLLFLTTFIGFISSKYFISFLCRLRYSARTTIIIGYFGYKMAIRGGFPFFVCTNLNVQLKVVAFSYYAIVRSVTTTLRYWFNVCRIVSWDFRRRSFKLLQDITMNFSPALSIFTMLSTFLFPRCDVRRIVYAYSALTSYQWLGIVSPTAVVLQGNLFFE